MVALRRKLVLALLLGVVLWNGAVIRSGSSELAYAWTAPDQEEHSREAEEERHELYFKIINFTLLVVALGYVLRKPMAEFFSVRSEGIRKALEEGRAALAESQAKLNAVEEKVRHLEEEIAGFKASAEQEMQEERRRLRDETGREAEKILEAARVRMDSAVRVAKLELKHFTAQEALRLADQMIRERLDEPTRQTLVRRFMAALGSKESRV